MKKLFLPFLGMVSTGLLVSCQKNETTPSANCQRTGYVIGKTPCQIAGTTGLIIALESPRDTVYTYNLPAEAFTYTPGTLMSGRGDNLFALSVRTNAKITLGYSLLAPKDHTPAQCAANIYLGGFLSMTHDQEVSITCASAAVKTP